MDTLGLFTVSADMLICVEVYEVSRSMESRRRGQGTCVPHLSMTDGQWMTDNRNMLLIACLGPFSKNRTTACQYVNKNVIFEKETYAA